MGPKRKRIHKNQITGQQGVNLTERAVLEMGFAWHPTNQALEAGIDGIIEVIDKATGEATNNIIQVQVKTTTKKWSFEDGTTFTYLCKVEDIDYWMRGNTPVVLVAVRPDGKEAYWADIKEAFNDPARRKDRHLHFNKDTQRFDASAASELIKLAVPKDVGPYLPATEHKEALFSNLLEVEQFPDYIYVASTDYRKPQEIFDWRNENDIQMPSGWVLTEKSIRSVHDLKEEPFRQLVDVGTVERFDLSEWSETDDPDRQREFVHLMDRVLNNDLRSRGLWRSSVEHCFYFPALPGYRVNSYRYKSLARETPRKVATIRRDRETKDVVYIKHTAFRYDWVRLDDRWYLAIVPHYFYSTDNKTTYPYAEELLSGIKRLERQGAVLGQVVMWKEKLTESDTLFHKVKPMIKFGNLLRYECHRGLDEKSWLRNDPLVEDSQHTGSEWGLV